VAAPVRYGLKGAITPAKIWRMTGTTGLHILKLDCGRFGRGPMHLSVDGKRAATFAKPGRKQPSILTAPMAIDGRQVVIYAESRDFGDSVRCDVFVDGTSLWDSSPLAAVAGRTTDARLSSALYRSPLDPIQMSRRIIQGWMAAIFGLGALRALIGAAQKSLRSGFMLVIWGVSIWVIGFASLRLLNRVASRPRLRGVLATGIIVGCVLADAAVFGFLYWIGFT
jgi:hypothetical protein